MGYGSPYLGSTKFISVRRVEVEEAFVIAVIANERTRALEKCRFRNSNDGPNHAGSISRRARDARATFCFELHMHL